MKFLFSALLILTSASVFSQKSLHIYGGRNNDVYLGCVNCNEYDTNSIWNSYGAYGSRYSVKSIWNNYGTYGSTYSQNSPWNQYATDVPVVVDKEGNFYGYLTLNQYKPKRWDSSLAMTLYKFYDVIPDDVSKWYKKIFN